MSDRGSLGDLGITDRGCHPVSANVTPSAQRREPRLTEVSGYLSPT